MNVCLYVFVFSVSSNENGQQSDEPDQVVEEKETKRQLWVDQYSPHHFTELLSDDVRDNREHRGFPTEW